MAKNTARRRVLDMREDEAFSGHFSGCRDTHHGKRQNPWGKKRCPWEFLELCRMHVYHCVYAKPHKPVSICPPVELLHNSVIYIWKKGKSYWKHCFSPISPIGFDFNKLKKCLKSSWNELRKEKSKTIPAKLSCGRCFLLFKIIL